MQENKISTFQNMISLDGVSWHPRCAPEVEKPKLDRVSTHGGVEANPALSWVII